MRRTRIESVTDALTKTTLVVMTIGIGVLMAYVVAHDDLKTKVALVQKAHS